MKNLKKILYKTTRPRALIFDMNRHLVDFCQDCSNYAPGAKITLRKKLMIRNQYTHVPHLTQDTIWESDKITKTSHTRERRGQPIPIDNKAERNRQDSMTKKNMKDKKQKESTKEALSWNGQ